MYCGRYLGPVLVIAFRYWYCGVWFRSFLVSRWVPVFFPCNDVLPGCVLESELTVALTLY
jgi:hypothetical protein